MHYCVTHSVQFYGIFHIFESFAKTAEQQCKIWRSRLEAEILKSERIWHENWLGISLEITYEIALVEYLKWFNI